MFAVGAAMGFTPAEVKASSLWEFKQAIAGYVRVNSSSDDVKPPSPEEFEAAIAAVN